MRQWRYVCLRKLACCSFLYMYYCKMYPVVENECRIVGCLHGAVGLGRPWHDTMALVARA